MALHIFLGAFTYVVVYTIWLKRRSWLNVVIGGLAGSFAVLAGGALARPELCLPPVVFAAVLFLAGVVIAVNALERPELADAWGVLGLPTTFIVDRGGQPRRVNHGVVRADHLKQQVELAAGTQPVQ